MGLIWVGGFKSSDGLYFLDRLHSHAQNLFPVEIVNQIFNMLFNKDLLAFCCLV